MNPTVWCIINGRQPVDRLRPTPCFANSPLATFLCRGQLMMSLRFSSLIACAASVVSLVLLVVPTLADDSTEGNSAKWPPEGFVSLFDGKTFNHWKVPEGDNGHWKIIDGVIDYDASSEAPGDKNLWSEKEYGDFTLLADWRIKETPYINPRVPIIKPDGTHKKDVDGNEIRISVPDSDSGVFLRGEGKSQVNIWCWPVGSGEVYGYRMDKSMPTEVRAGVTPKMLADKDLGEWNTFEITMRGDRLWVKLNGHQVIENAQLPGIPSRGPIALQHHGGKDAKGEWRSPPALVQFRNIAIRELD